MASFNGTISYEGTEPTEAHIQQATRHALDVRMLKEQSGLSRLTKSFDLPDGAQVYVLDYEHVWKVHIVPPEGYAIQGVELPPVGEDFPGGFAGIAGFISGTTTSGLMDVGREVEWGYPDFPGAPEGTANHAKIVNGGLTRESAELFTTSEAELKLGVHPWVSFFQLGDEKPRTQFHFIKPGNYTGAMASIIQLLLGVGRQVKPDYEDRWLERNPRETKLTLENEMNKFGYGGSYSGVSGATGDTDRAIYDRLESGDKARPYPSQVQISYDPRWNRTHGIMWGKNNNDRDVPILVEVAQRGVRMMPFPVHKLSTTEAARRQYEKVYPALAKYTPFKGGRETLFEAFGGFPTGENIPGAFQQLLRWERAGVVVKAEQGASEFYSGTSAMCTYFGWAFHPSRPRAMNVGWRREGGRKVGVCYEVRLDVREKPDNQKVRNSITHKVIAALQLSDPVDVYKAERLPQDFAEQMVADPDYEVFEEFEVEPDWLFTCNTVLLRKGFIDYPNIQCPGDGTTVNDSFTWSSPMPWFTSHMLSGAFAGGGGVDPCALIPSPHFKYYEPFLGQVVGFDFSNTALPSNIRSDGPIFCTYTSRGPEILYYSYIDPPAGPSRTYNTRAYCQYTGSWTEGVEPSPPRMLGYFYSTSRDFRKHIAVGGGRHKVVTGHRSGYTDFLSFCGFFAMHGVCSRRYYGYTTWVQEQWTHRDYEASVICASDNRSAFLVCTEARRTGLVKSQGQTKNDHIGNSGYTRVGQIYNFYAHWSSVCRPSNYPHPSSPEVAAGRFTIELERPGVHPCFGSARPTDPGYSIYPSHGMGNPSDPSGVTTGRDQVSTFDGETHRPWEIIQSAAYNDNRRTVGDSWSESHRPEREFDWAVWGMGLDYMNAVKLDGGKEYFSEDADPQEIPLRATSHNWWQCTVPGECPMPPYWVSANYYGPYAVSTYRNIEMSGIKNIGARLSVPFGPASTPFGVVE